MYVIPPLDPWLLQLSGDIFLAKVTGRNLTPLYLGTCTFRKASNSHTNLYPKRHCPDNPQCPSSPAPYQSWLLNDGECETLVPAQEFTVLTLSYTAIPLMPLALCLLKILFGGLQCLREHAKIKTPYFLSLLQVSGSDRNGCVNGRLCLSRQTDESTGLP